MVVSPKSNEPVPENRGFNLRSPPFELARSTEAALGLGRWTDGGGGGAGGQLLDCGLGALQGAGAVRYMEEGRWAAGGTGRWATWSEIYRGTSLMKKLPPARTLQ